jgi:hypothetical protein
MVLRVLTHPEKGAGEFLGKKETFSIKTWVPEWCNFKIFIFSVHLCMHNP